MEKERTPLSQEDINAIMEKLRSYRRYDEEKLALIQADLEWGLTKEETEQYTNRKYDIRQMRVYSNCLRKGCDKDALDVLCAKGLGNSQMEVLYELFDKGVPLDVIKQIKDETNASPKKMKEAFNIYQRKIDESIENKACDKEKTEDATDVKYAGALLSEIKAVVSKISFQENRFDVLNEKLKQIEVAKDDEAIRQDLINQLNEKDQMLSDKQNELNRALGKISSLRTENEKLKAELAKRKVNDEKALVNETNVLKNNEASQTAEERNDEEMENVAFKDIPIGVKGIGVGIPIYYQVPVIDKRGGRVMDVHVGNLERKSTGMFAMLSKIFFKKKSRADIVRLVSSGDLVPAQLVQIKNAIEKGLREEQLVELINNNLSPEKMKEIIEIAVLENSMSF